MHSQVLACTCSISANKDKLLDNHIDARAHAEHCDPLRAHIRVERQTRSVAMLSLALPQKILSSLSKTYQRSWKTLGLHTAGALSGQRCITYGRSHCFSRPQFVTRSISVCDCCSWRYLSEGSFVNAGRTPRQGAAEAWRARRGCM
jgi:hypothetical protein